MIGFYRLIKSKKMIKSIVFLVLVEVSIIVFFLGLGFHSRLVPPVGITPGEITHAADPLPQALMITAVVVGLATTAINITMFITLFRKHKSGDWDFVKSEERDDAC
jgi:multicomponent Na+:H+ antiporter subunit C